MFRRKHWKLHKFLFPIQKEVTRIDNKREEIGKNMSCRLQFIDNAKFLGSLLSSLANNLAEGVHKMKCKYEHNNKKCETWGIKYKYRDCFIENTSFNDGLVEY